MTEAIFGLIGVIVGGVINGGVTWLGARSSRRATVRRSRRLAWAFAQDVEMISTFAVEGEAPSPTFIDQHLRIPMQALEEERRVLADDGDAALWDALIHLIRLGNMMLHANPLERDDWVDLLDAAKRFNELL